MTGFGRPRRTRRRMAGRRSAASRAMAQLLRGGLLATLVLVLCIGAVLARLSFGPISADALAEPIARALDEQLAPGWSARIANTGIAFSTHGPALLSEGIEIRQPDGAIFLSAREGEIAIDPAQLLFGRVEVTAITFAGIDLRLSFMPDGTLRTDAAPTVTDAGPPQPPPPPAPPADRMDKAAFDAAVVSVIDLLSDETGLARSLDSIALSDARITIIDTHGKERISFSEVEASVRRNAADTLSISAKARGTAGAWTLDGAINGIAGGERTVDVAVAGVPLADLLLVANAEHGPVSGDLILSARAQASVSADKRLTTLAGALESSPGTIIYHDKDQPPLKVTRFRLEAQRDPATGDLLIPAVGLDIGGARFDLAGGVRLGDGEHVWRLILEGKDAILPPLSDDEEQLSIDSLSLDMAGETDGRLRILRLAAAGAGFGVALNGEAGGPDNPGGMRLGIRTARSDARAIMHFWPAFVTPEPRRYLIENLSEGVLDTLDVAVSLSGDQLEASRRREPLPHEVARTQFSAVDVTLRAAPGFPPLTDMTISGLVTGASADITATSARAEVAPGQTLGLTEGRVVMKRLTAPINAAIDFRLRGPASGLAHLLEREALRPMFNLDIAPDSVHGMVDIAVSLSLPLVKDLKPDQVRTDVTGILRNLAVDVGREKLTNGDLTLTVNDKGLFLNGTGNIAGLPAAIELKKPMHTGGKGGEQGRADITFKLDDAARAAMGFNLGNKLRGPISVRIDAPFGGSGGAPLKIAADLTAVRINDLLPGWSKAAGKPGRLTFSATDNNGFTLSDIVLDAGAAARGQARFEAGGNLASAALTGVRLSPNDDLSVDVAAAGGGHRVTVRGNLLDARPFLRAAQSGLTGAETGGGNSGLPPLDVDLSVNILGGFHGETLTKAALRLETRGGNVAAFNIKGSFSGAALEASLTGKDETIVLKTANAGALLRFADLYAHLAGGNLQANMTKSGGQLLMHDFAIRNEPTMQHLLTESPRRLPVDPGNIAFTKMRVIFTRAAGRVFVQEGVVWGPSVGITFEGNIDIPKDAIDLTGTYVPAYALNNMVSQIPVLGTLLGGGQYGGLFAVNFRARGPMASPSITVNPLSAIAPGILRKFFELGRADDGQTPASGIN